MDGSDNFEPVTVGSPYYRSVYQPLLTTPDASISLSTTYHKYPQDRPFINTEFRRSPAKPSTKSYPENNRDAVVTALQNLQEKVKRLELERSAAEDNLKSLASETTKYKDILFKEQENQEATQSMMSKHTQELESQLSSAETRCNLLEKQLDYMRKMVHNSERDRQDAVHRTLIVERQKEEAMPENVRAHLERITDLEREHLKLTATQTLAEGKIRELEDRLREERINRRLMQNRAAELETEAAKQRILLNGDAAVRTSVKPKKTVKKKKKKIVSARKNGTTNHRKTEPNKHYRLNLAEIPFVAGKSTAPSHAVGANVQKVLAMMKTHNLALCSAVDSYMDIPRTSSSSSGSSTTSLDNDLADLLLQLQDEFGQLSCEHQELVKQINEASDYRVQEDLERELDVLVSKMEGKGHQISKVRQHQQKVDDMKRKIRKNSRTHHEFPPRPKSAMTCVNSGKRTEESQRACNRKKTLCCSNDRPLSARTGLDSLDVLKDMKKLQTTLRRDDLSWD